VTLSARTARSAPRARALVATALASMAVHAAALALTRRLGPPPAPPARPIEVAFEVAPPPPPPPPPPRRAPAAPRAVAAATLPARAEPVLPPPLPAPGPTPETAPARPVPRVGVSLSSTVTGGGFAVGIGNTLHGRASEVAADPASVKPYAAGGASAQPRLLEQPEVSYPEAARRAGVEGPVVLLLHLDRSGRVVAARVLAEPGAGLGEAARAGALRFRFSPALLEGAPVETEIRFTYTFVLE